MKIRVLEYDDYFGVGIVKILDVETGKVYDISDSDCWNCKEKRKCVGAVDIPTAFDNDEIVEVEIICKKFEVKA